MGCFYRPISDSFENTRDPLGEEENIYSSHFKFLSLIAKGSYADTKVKAVLHVKKNKYYAIKQFNLDLDNIQIISNELILQRSFKHRNILPIVNMFTEDMRLFCIYPLMSYGSCLDILKNHFTSGFPERLVVMIIREVLMALIYIHNRDIVHSQVKSNHVLICEGGHVKLTGFNCAQSLLMPGRHLRQLHALPRRLDFSLCYASPEQLAQDMRGYDSLTDIYSLGLTACELINGVLPYSDMPITQMHLEKYFGTTPKIKNVSQSYHLNTNKSSGVGEINDSLTSNMDNSQNNSDTNEPPTHHFLHLIHMCLRNKAKRKSAMNLIYLTIFKELKKCNIEEEILKELINYKNPILNKKVKIIKPDALNEASVLSSIGSRSKIDDSSSIVAGDTSKRLSMVDADTSVLSAVLNSTTASRSQLLSGESASRAGEPRRSSEEMDSDTRPSVIGSQLSSQVSSITGGGGGGERLGGRGSVGGGGAGGTVGVNRGQRATSIVETPLLVIQDNEGKLQASDYSSDSFSENVQQNNRDESFWDFT